VARRTPFTPSFPGLPVLCQGCACCFPTTPPSPLAPLVWPSSIVRDFLLVSGSVCMPPRLPWSPLPAFLAHTILLPSSTLPARLGSTWVHHTLARWTSVPLLPLRLSHFSDVFSHTAARALAPHCGLGAPTLLFRRLPLHPRPIRCPLVVSPALPKHPPPWCPFCCLCLSISGAVFCSCPLWARWLIDPHHTVTAFSSLAPLVPFFFAASAARLLFPLSLPPAADFCGLPVADLHPRGACIWHLPTRFMPLCGPGTSPACLGWSSPHVSFPVPVP